MRMRIALSALVMSMMIAATSCSPPDEKKTAGAGQGDPNALKVAVVTGGHEFDVINFHRLFRRMPGIDAYPQHIEHFASSPEEIRDAYDVVLFYGMGRGGEPAGEGARYEGNPKAALQRIVDRGQGVVILHHALLAWEEWEYWNQLIGFDNRSFAYKEGLDLTIAIADDAHPVTEGLSDFDILDEGYDLHGEHDGEGAVLLTTEHKGVMPEVAWARQQGKCRIFCLALGHDNEAWTNDSFQEILRRGIAWSAGKLGDDAEE